MFLIKQCMFAAAAAALASFHRSGSPRGWKGTVLLTAAPNLSPPKYTWKVWTGRKLDLVSLAVKNFL